MLKKPVKKLLENTIELIKKGVKVAEQKIDEQNRKWLGEQERIRKQNEIRWANILKADFKAIFETILREDIHFTDGKVCFRECYYDSSKNQCWRMTLETLVNNQYDMEHSRVLTSLNETKNNYLTKLRLDRDQELMEVDLMKQNPNVNPVDIQLAYEQIQRKYKILNCQFAFHFIKDEEKKNERPITIGVLFRG